MVSNNAARIQVLLQLKDEATKGLRDFQHQTEQTQKTFRRAAVFMSGASAVLGGALFSVIRASRTQEDALTKLQGSLERTGVSYEDVSESILEKVDDLAGRTDFSRADIFEALSLLTDMTGNADEAIGLLGLSLDVASQRGVSLETATRNVTRAVRDGAGELAENYIKELITATTKTERLTLVTDRYGGAAERNRDPIKSLSSSITDLLASFGVIEIVNEGADALANLATSVGKLDPALLHSVGTGLIVLFAFTSLAAGVSIMAGLITPMGAAIGALGALGILGAIGIGAFVNRLEDGESPGRAFLGILSDIVNSSVFDSDFFDANLLDFQIWVDLVKTLAKLASPLKLGIEFTFKLVGGAFNEVMEFLRTYMAVVIQATKDPKQLPGIKDLFDFVENGINIGGGGIPGFAHGGIVTRPTLGVIGEAGPEAVIPLNRAGGMLGAASPSVVINFSDIVLLDNEASMNRLATIIHRKLRNLNRAYPGLA